MNSNDKTWINQQLMFYKDNLFNSDGLLEISLATSTQDFKNFSPVSLSFVITSNGTRRMVSLGYQNVVDLLISIKEVMSNVEEVFKNSNNNEIVKKYYNDRNLKFQFKLSQSNERVIIISIIHTNTDYTQVIIPIQMFSGLSKLLNSFACDFIKINFDLINRTLLSELLDSSKLIRNGILVLPTTINSNTNSNEKVLSSGMVSFEEKEEKENELMELENRLNEFDKFLGPGMTNIKIDEIDVGVDRESKKINGYAKNIEVSEFISKVLKNDLSVLEDTLLAISSAKNPFEKICNIINESIGIDLTPDIKLADYNSIVYISKLLQNLSLKEYTLKGTPIPGTFTPLRYEPKVEEIKSGNTELAYDILTIFLYIRTLKSILEKKVEDSFLNKTAFLMNIRLFLDPLCFSFLNHKDPEIIKTSILSRFKKFDETGFFEKYTERLDMYNISKITEKEISQLLNIVLEKIIGKNLVISEVHTSFYDSNNGLLLPYDSNLTTEQIINYLIPIEILQFIKPDLDEEMLKNEFDSDIPKEVLSILRKEKKVETKVKTEHHSNILRFTNFNDSDIPNSFKADFLNYVKEIGDQGLDYDFEKFPIEEIGETLVVGLNEWNESTKKEGYQDFFLKISNSLLTKDMIVAKVKRNIKTETADWSDVNFNLDEL